MPKFFVNKEQIEKQITILEEDAKHIKTVLRKKEGEKLIIEINKDIEKYQEIIFVA